MTRFGLSGILTGCFDDYLEFREGIEALRTEAKTRERVEKGLENLHEEILKDAENQD